MKNLIQKSSIVTVLIFLLMTATLTACSSKKETEESNISQAVAASETITEAEETAAEEAKTETDTTTESTVAPTTEASPDPTPEPTPEAVSYEGIDMESTLPGAEWIQTFVGIIDEPKVVVFSDETGRKEIIENDGIVNFNPDVDFMAVYLPEGVKVIRKTKGISIKESANNEGCGEIYKLDSTKTRERRRQLAALYVEVNGEEVALTFDFRPE